MEGSIWLFIVFQFLTLGSIAESSVSYSQNEIDFFQAQQVETLKIKILQFKNLKNLIENTAFFKNWKGQCPTNINRSLVECSNQNRTSCICWSIGKIQVNWIKANSFCNYYGMNLISFSSNNLTPQDMMIKNVMAGENVPFWTSAQDFITRSVWVFRSGEFLTQKEHYKTPSMNGLEPSSKNIDETSCISASLANNATDLKFTPTSCFDEYRFICQQQPVL